MVTIPRYQSLWRVVGEFEKPNGTTNPFCCGVTTDENGTILKEGTAPLVRRRFAGLHISRLKCWNPVQSVKEITYYVNDSLTSN